MILEAANSRSVAYITNPCRVSRVVPLYVKNRVRSSQESQELFPARLCATWFCQTEEGDHTSSSTGSQAAWSESGGYPAAIIVRQAALVAGTCWNITSRKELVGLGFLLVCGREEKGSNNCQRQHHRLKLTAW